MKGKAKMKKFIGFLRVVFKSLVVISMGFLYGLAIPIEAIAYLLYMTYWEFIKKDPEGKYKWWIDNFEITIDDILEFALKK